MQHQPLPQPFCGCRSSSCKSYVIPQDGDADGKGNRTLLLAIVDCDDVETIARLREILPEVTLVNETVAAPSTLLDHRSAGLRPQVHQAFTGRQREILHYLSQGLSNKEIGRRLGISHFTVRNHVSKLLQVLNMGSRREVASLAYPERLGLSA